MAVIDGYHGPLNPNPGPPNGEAEIVIYGYIPSASLPIVALVTFAIVLAFRTFYLMKWKRTRVFESLVLLGCVMELIGYAFRLVSHYNPFKINPFIVQYFMIVVAPVPFSAAIYLALSLSTKNNPEVLPIPRKLAVAVFATIDIITTLLQSAGSALLGVSESKEARGETFALNSDDANDILLAGLCVQTFSFMVFFLVLILVTRRNETHLKENGQRPLSGRLLITMCLSSFPVLLRTVFRLAETAQGVFGSASTHESLFGTLEYTPIILMLCVWTILPLEYLLSRQDRIQAARAKESKGSNED